MLSVESLILAQEMQDTACNFSMMVMTWCAFSPTHGGYCGIIRCCSFLPSTCFQVKQIHSPLGGLQTEVESKPPIICHVIELKAYACSSQVCQLFSFQWCTLVSFSFKKVEPVPKQHVLSEAWERENNQSKMYISISFTRPIMYGLNNSVCLCCTGNSCFECGSDTFPVLLTRKHIHHHHLSSVILFLIIDYYSCETWSEFFKKRKRQESLVSLMTTDYTIISTRSGFFCDALQN